jgi:uncharacterized protein
MTRQAKVLDFLGQPQAYAPAPPTVERIETHVSVVFLAGPFAYKVKRAVKYNFLDFSTLEKRRIACLNELRVNARTAPRLYLEVVALTIGSDGGFRLEGDGEGGKGGGEGEIVEWLLKMRRFDQAALYDHMAAEGRLDLSLMPRLADVIAAFHDSADRTLTASQAVRPLESVLADNAKTFAAHPAIFGAQAPGALADESRARLAALAPLLVARAHGGYVRHCHGDLHLRNIVEIDGSPVLFDAIEFDDQLATVDVLYDLAFLLMDLGKRGLASHANTVLNAYLDAEGSTGNLVGLAALPLFLPMRAAVRAKVELLRASVGAADKAEAASKEANAYFTLAQVFLAPQAPRLVAIGGLSGSGKSAIARAIAPHIGAFPGAVHVRSDVERKRLFGVAPVERLPQEAYTPEVTEWVYAICRKRAALALEGGRAVIVDAVYAKPEEREVLALLAADRGVPFTGLWLDAPARVLRDRIAARTGDASDATPELVDVQQGYAIGPQCFDVIDASGAVDQVALSCLARIGFEPLKA